MTEKTLPARPSLEQYKKQAKDLLKARIDAAPEALARIRQHHPRLRNSPDAEIQRAAFKLADAQLIIAREHAFETWPKFSSHVLAMHAASLIAGIAGRENARGVILVARVGDMHAGLGELMRELNRASLCTVAVPLSTDDFDPAVLGRRTIDAMEWIQEQSDLGKLPLGLLGTGTGSAAAVFAAAERPESIRAVALAGGRPDLAGPWAWKIQAPTLFLVGRTDAVEQGFTRTLMNILPPSLGHRLAVVEGAHHPLDEGAVHRTAESARDWFVRRMFRHEEAR